MWYNRRGSADYADKVALLRSEYSQQGINFYYHVDAAYGGYMRSIFLMKIITLFHLIIFMINIVNIIFS